MILGLICFTAGCNSDAAPTNAGNEVTGLATAEDQDKPVRSGKYCVMTATEEQDGRFLMLDELFSDNIPCESDMDCINYLLEDDEYRSLKPDFEQYLACEELEIKEIVSQN